METNNSKEDIVDDSTNSKDSEEDESFVTKVRSRVSGLFNSSISRLFKNQDKKSSGIVRLRPSEDEETNQPPRKKARGLENDILPSKFNRENNTVTELSNNSANGPGLGNNFEPIAGPSYISQRSTQNIISTPLTSTEVTNRDNHVDSAYSSMAKVCNKPSEVLTSDVSLSLSKPTDNNLSERKSLFNITSPETPNRSLFADLGGSPQDKNSSLRSRGPCFNSTTFGSPSFMDRTVSTNKIMSSPFYGGRTIYGGASAYGRQLGMNDTRQQQLKNSFLVKPINKSSESKSFTSLSKTARRILETLEQCSNPMADVRKVPLPTRSEKQGLFSKYVAVNPYQKHSKSSSKELLVPSVSERLKMKQMQRLQDKTNEIRQIATSSSSSLNTEEYRIASDNQQKHTNKMKSKISSVRAKPATIEIIDNYILNPVPLMLPENKLPKFDLPDLKVPAMTASENKDKPFTETKKPNSIKSVLNIDEETLKVDKEIPATEKQIKSVIQQSNRNELKTVVKDTESGNKDNVVEYIFSKPLVIADNSKSIIAINNFKFSEPLSKKIKFTENICEPTQKKLHNETKLTNGNISGESDMVKPKTPINPLMEKFKPPEGTWECQTCLIRNKSGVTKCAACETPKVETQNSKKDSVFGSQFSRKIDEWDCSTCLVRNKVENVVCVACSTPKISKAEVNGIGNKFKMQSKEWECKTCWVRNKNESTKCVACETARTGCNDLNAPYKTSKCPKCFNEIKEKDGQCVLCEKSNVKSNFPSHLKPSSDTWECGTCLIRNKNELKTCAACETPREKNTNEIKPETLSKSSDKWECPTCMVRNNSEVEKCPCCETAKPGITLVSKSNVSMFNFGVNKTQFSFGIPKDMQSSNPPTTSSLFSKNATDTSGTPPVFKFGITPENKEKDKAQTEPKISFPPLTSTETKLQLGKEENEKTPSATFQFKTPSAVPDKNSAPVFKFGSESKEPAKDGSVANPLFKFEPPKQKTEENTFKIHNDLKPPAEGLKKLENTSTAVPSVSKSDSAAPLFSFGSKDNSKDQTEKPMFSFGSSSSSTPSFSFNPVKNDVTQKPPSAAGFSAPPLQQPQSTSSGSTTLKNGGFNFGSTSTNSNQAAVFSFGAAQNPAETTQLPKSGFDFSSAVKPTGGFNFTSPAPAFDGGAKPTFNFTGGSVPTFSANPTESAGGPVPVRKFKRAVRRTQR